MRLIGFFQRGHLLGGKLDVQGGHRLFQVLHLAGPDDGGADTGLVQHPGQGYLHSRPDVYIVPLSYIFALSANRSNWIAILCEWWKKRGGAFPASW